MRYFVKINTLILCIILPILANAQSYPLTAFDADATRYLVGRCEEGRLAFHLYKNKKVIFSIYNDDYCSMNIGYDDITIAGKKIIYVPNESHWMTKGIYNVDVHHNTIKYIATIPIDADTKNYLNLKTVISGTQNIYRVDSAHVVQSICENGKINFRLLKNKKQVFSIYTIDNCNSSVNYNIGFHGQKIIYVEQNEPSYSPKKSKNIYIINTETDMISFAGTMPPDVDIQNDDSFIYEFTNSYSKNKIVYTLENDKFTVKKNTMLVFNGKVCIKTTKQEAYSTLTKNWADINCEDGIEATEESPVCVETSYKRYNIPEIIPLSSCDIKKEEIKGDARHD